MPKKRIYVESSVISYRIEATIRRWGLTPAKVVTPERLLEESL